MNVDGYYNSLLSFMDKAVDEGFVTPAARHIIVSAQTAHELMCKLEVCYCILLKAKEDKLKHNCGILQNLRMKAQL